MIQVEYQISLTNHHIVLVPKKDGPVGFGINFCKFNKDIEFVAKPMLNIEEVINKISGHIYYSEK